MAESAADIDGWIRSALESVDSIPKAPPAPHSDIRRIGSTQEDPDEDPLAMYASALAPPRRMPRETVMLAAPMRPRQATLVMVDRPSALSPATPPMTIVPVHRPVVEEPRTPLPFRGAMPVLSLAFGLGIFLAGLVVFMMSRM